MPLRNYSLTHYRILPLVSHQGSTDIGCLLSCHLEHGVFVLCLLLLLLSSIATVCMCSSVPLPADRVTCGRLTSSSVEVHIFPPNMSPSAFNIVLYDVTYKSVIDSHPQRTTHRVAYSDGSVTADSLTQVSAGVTYRVTVVSRSGHLMSQAVNTSCTAGQLCLVSHDINNSKIILIVVIMFTVRRDQWHILCARWHVSK